MKIRYYLRGLGLGILITAVFFLLGDNSGKTMSDEMIKARAKELGMVESTVLADISESVQETEESVSTEMAVEEIVTETEETMIEESSEEVSEVIESTEVVSEEESTATEEESEELTDEEETVKEVISEEENSEESVPTGQMISIVVNKGEGSDTVSQRLYEAGLIDDPYAYDRYLMQNGYDKRIGAGEHMVPMGADWQEIAQILTS
ncbi:MAG: hypothetical protein J5983_03995 [Ruminococcus sp.]|nr:hypothetical protein [Ruminococcus sp.]